MKAIKLVIGVLFFVFVTGQMAAQDNGSRVTDSEVEKIVNKHNEYRNDVGVSNLKWSNHLAIEAQKWADELVSQNCAFKHSGSVHGENIYWSSGGSQGTSAVISWASEIKYYHGQKVSYSNYTKFGHYTQIVWYSTTEVGCAMSTCKNGSTIWVCNYNPPGNYIGSKAYGN